MMDRIALLASIAFGQARIVQMMLDETVLPALTPTQRTFAENLSRRIARDKIFDRSFLLDLDAFIAFIQGLIADGTIVGWEADEYNVHGGCDILHLGDQARALDPVVRELRELWAAIAETLDASKAIAAALNLVSE